MDEKKSRRGYGKLGGVAVGLILIIFFGIPAAGQESQRELGINGMAFVSEYGSFAMPGGLMNFSYLKKGIGGEGYLIYFSGADFGLLSFLFGGGIIANPFWEKPVSPCLGVGILMSPLGIGVWNAGGGLKIKFARTMGLRLEYRFCGTLALSRNSWSSFGFGVLTGGIYFIH